MKNNQKRGFYHLKRQMQNNIMWWNLKIEKNMTLHHMVIFHHMMAFHLIMNEWCACASIGLTTSRASLTVRFLRYEVEKGLRAVYWRPERVKSLWKMRKKIFNKAGTFSPGLKTFCNAWSGLIFLSAVFLLGQLGWAPDSWAPGQLDPGQLF